MAGSECFEQVWSAIVKSMTDPNRERELEDVIDENMAQYEKTKKTRKDMRQKPINPTENKTMQRMIARAKGNEPQRKQSPRTPVKLSETLERLHNKVRKD
tara:strand:- start:154 stop:453 length:300 start_codon:yes stop_codon:yes gene_type:complete